MHGERQRSGEPVWGESMTRAGPVEVADCACSLRGTKPTTAPLLGLPGTWPLPSSLSLFVVGLLVLGGLASFWIGSRIQDPVPQNPVPQNPVSQPLAENQSRQPSAPDASQATVHPFP